jgi:Cu(I)/Ag(I) efflux system membrane protein CusA/SilA
MVSSENAMLRGAVLFNVRDRDLGSTVHECKQKLEEMVKSLPKGYFLEWSGQYENQIRANRKLMGIIPIVLSIILLVVYFTYRSLKESLITLMTVPFALIGGIYIVWFYGINMSVAVPLIYALWHGY